MPTYIRTRYRGEESWYRVGFVFGSNFSDFDPEIRYLFEDKPLTLINVRGGRLDLTIDHDVLGMEDADDFSNLDWRNTILCNNDSAYGWLTAEGIFWGQDNELILEAAEYALRSYVVSKLSTSLLSRYAKSPIDALMETGAIYIHKRGFDFCWYDKDMHTPLTTAQETWLLANGFELKSQVS
jgi:hypothetical protein